MPQSFEILPGDSTSALVLLADHAMNVVPEPYGTLGLPGSAFSRHIAYDIGVESLTRGLSERLGVPAVMSTFSRLLIDPNRGEDDPTLIMKLSDGAIIPANHPLTASERERRLENWHRPYHRAVENTIAQVEEASGRTALVISIHSFTPYWKQYARPWHAGLLWDSDPRAVIPFLELLRQDPALVVGDNEPYDGALKNDCMYRHCTARGRPHALLEVRQDLIGDEAGIAAWVERLVPILERLNARSELHQTLVHASRADCDNPPLPM
ncbi:N-formylglutamate amidohydrolase [Pseudohoeflea suaedae]|uniref:N-formylglutamate amidohydrolase n=1 Tax=Pseudohoeflea suaedae TaxID=877384 RepID=A0A4R5PJV4_9HYPH|nr:N-formylglutamate amidohydrolase [Pseudohoeflea suaedae]TDH35865.1 N-formylglutamate amidohydrolase [Pseudohoeflea suaedae]